MSVCLLPGYTKVEVMDAVRVISIVTLNSRVRYGVVLKRVGKKPGNGGCREVKRIDRFSRDGVNEWR